MNATRSKSSFRSLASFNGSQSVPTERTPSVFGYTPKSWVFSRKSLQQSLFWWSSLSLLPSSSSNTCKLQLFEIFQSMTRTNPMPQQGLPTHEWESILLSKILSENDERTSCCHSTPDWLTVLLRCHRSHYTKRWDAGRGHPDWKQYIDGTNAFPNDDVSNRQTTKERVSRAFFLVPKWWHKGWTQSTYYNHHF